MIEVVLRMGVFIVEEVGDFEGVLNVFRRVLEEEELEEIRLMEDIYVDGDVFIGKVIVFEVEVDVEFEFGDL